MAGERLEDGRKDALPRPAGGADTRCRCCSLGPRGARDDPSQHLSTRMKIRYLSGGSLFAAGLTALAVAASAEQSASELAREPTGPIADRVTLPIHMSRDRSIGLTDEGTKLTIRTQPMIPFRYWVAAHTSAARLGSTLQAHQLRRKEEP